MDINKYTIKSLKSITNCIITPTAEPTALLTSFKHSSKTPIKHHTLQFNSIHTNLPSNITYIYPYHIQHIQP